MTGFRCRACEGSRDALLLAMGEVPLANAFVSGPDDDADAFRAPLDLVMCTDCSLVQIRDLVPREMLFREYLWVTGTSRAAMDHARWLTARLVEHVPPGGNPLLVEIASNDGSFLRHFRDAGYSILGVDPSNVALEADAAGLDSWREFFGVEVAERVLAERGPAAVVVARNVLGHSEALRDLMEGVRRLLAPGGRFVVEVPWVYLIRNELQYDYIFHEHVSYLSVGSLARLAAAFGLRIVDLTFVDMNGGSLLCELVHDDHPAPSADGQLVDFERFVRLGVPEGWVEFERRVQRQRRMLRELLAELREAGRTVVGYGAAAKCMTMLNFCDIGPDLLPVMGDANPRKQGLLCPGVRIPVVSPEDVVAQEPDVVMIGAWNFRDEIMSLFKERYGYRGEFLVPIPVPELVR